jgi:sugar phosphate isomerase/epimerase
MGDFGIVSNCWRVQLEAGKTLDELLAKAEEHGYGHIELRQGCLGAYERIEVEGALPEVDALARLPASFPRLRFNLALALPFLGAEMGPETPLFQAGVRGAVALAGAGTAHLRLVDTETAAEAVTPTEETRIAPRLAGLASTCADRGAVLSVENARQPWAALRRIVARARQALGSSASALGFCYDPCNLLSAADRPDPQRETAHLRADEIALFHLKQSRSGTLLPAVEPGEIDWPAQLTALRRIGYVGPRLFEIAPGPDVWEQLARSRRYAGEISGSSQPSSTPYR